MFLHNFSTFFSSPSREECSISTETPQFSLENESNPELNYTKYINLDFSDEEKRQSLSDFPKKTEETPNENRNSSGFFKPIFSNLQDFVASQLSQSNYSRLLEKSKRIIKRENAKKRVKLAKQQKPVEKREESQEICEKNEEKTCKKQEICKTSDKEIKKIVQKLRNRISAQQSRDRKKQYLESLERENANLQREIQQLRGEKVGNEEKKLNPLGILKLGMTFLSMFMIIVGGKEKLGDNKGIVIGENVIGDNNLGRSLWGLDENRGKNEEIIRDILMKMKMYFFFYYYYHIFFILLLFFIII